MALNLGIGSINKLYLGATEINKAYLGSLLVYGGVVPILLLDLYPNAVLAYSLRYLKASYIGSPVVRVRRSSDNAELDFTPTKINDGTLTTWTGVSDGFITIWYDQSGNVNNGRQTSASNQVKIVDLGVLITDGGLAAIDFNDNGNSGFVFDTRITTIRSVFQVLNAVSNTGSFTQYLLGDISRYDYASGDSNQLLSSEHSNIYVKNGNNYINSLLTNFTTTNRPLVQSLITMIHTTSAVNASRISADRNLFPSRTWEGKMQEVIIYNTDQSANRSGIENNINTEYSIY
jgi:hypothetical protein